MFCFIALLRAFELYWQLLTFFILTFSVTFVTLFSVIQISYIIDVYYVKVIINCMETVTAEQQK